MALIHVINNIDKPILSLTSRYVLVTTRKSESSGDLISFKVVLKLDIALIVQYKVFYYNNHLHHHHHLNNNIL